MVFSKGIILKENGECEYQFNVIIAYHGSSSPAAYATLMQLTSGVLWKVKAWRKLDGNFFSQPTQSSSPHFAYSSNTWALATRSISIIMFLSLSAATSSADFPDELLILISAPVLINSCANWTARSLSCRLGLIEFGILGYWPFETGIFGIPGPPLTPYRIGAELRKQTDRRWVLSVLPPPRLSQALIFQLVNHTPKFFLWNFQAFNIYLKGPCFN